MYLLSSFWQKIIQWDHDLFIKLNSKRTNPFFDTIMPFMRQFHIRDPALPVHPRIGLVNFRIKAYWWIIFFLVTVALTDMTGT
jgi:hypothetical protein